MQQNKKQSWFSTLFCHCVREEPVHENRFLRSISSNMNLKRPEPNLGSNKQIDQQWIQETTSFEVDCNEEEDSIPKQNLLNRQLSYLVEESKMQKTSFSDEFHSSMFEMKLLHKCGGLLVRQTSFQAESISNEWIIKIYKDVQFYNSDKSLEKKFRDNLVPSSIIAAINKRIKSDNILIAHDPTGSIVLKLGNATRQLRYIEQEKTFSTVIERGIQRFKIKAERILKMDIQQKMETVIINLMHIEQIYLKSILYEYLEIAHDVILILPGNMENLQIFLQAEQAIANSEQSRESCSVDLQHIIENNLVIGKVLYFGNACEVTLNDELNFLYSCLDSQVKKHYNYKLLLKDLRLELGMSELVRQFNKSGLIQDSAAFDDFISSQNLIRKYVQSTESSSSTESEGEMPDLGDPQQCHSVADQKQELSLSPVKKKKARSQPHIVKC